MHLFAVVAGELILANNNIEGLMPESLVDLANLQILNLEWNFLRGPFPSGFATGLQKLRILNLSHNFCAGQIPANIGEMSELTEIHLNSNQRDTPIFGFSGPIPASIGLLHKLTRLDLHKNRLSGALPAQLGFMNKLEVLD